MTFYFFRVIFSVVDSLVGLVEIAATHVSVVARSLLDSSWGSLHAVGAASAVVAHVQPGLSAEATVSGIVEDTGRVLGIVAQVVKAIEVAVL